MDFLRALGETELPRRPKIVFCTTENGTGHITTAIEAGADEYVMEPFDRETLVSKLESSASSERRAMAMAHQHPPASAQSRRAADPADAGG